MQNYNSEEQIEKLLRVIVPLEVEARSGTATMIRTPSLNFMKACDDTCNLCDILWKQTKGILPSSGQMWLTPDMEREARNLEESLNQEKEVLDRLINLVAENHKKTSDGKTWGDPALVGILYDEILKLAKSQGKI